MRIRNPTFGIIGTTVRTQELNKTVSSVMAKTVEVTSKLKEKFISIDNDDPLIDTDDQSRKFIQLEENIKYIVIKANISYIKLPLALEDYNITLYNVSEDKTDIEILPPTGGIFHLDVVGDENNITLSHGVSKHFINIAANVWYEI